MILSTDLPLKAIKKVTPKEDYILVIEFFDDSVKSYDMKPHIEKYEPFRPLKNPSLFAKARAEAGAVVWNDEIDIAQEHLYEFGTDI